MGFAYADPRPTLVEANSRSRATAISEDELDFFACLNGAANIRSGFQKTARARISSSNCKRIEVVRSHYNGNTLSGVVSSPNASARSARIAVRTAPRVFEFLMP